MSDNAVINNLFLKQLQGIGNAAINKRYIEFLNEDLDILVKKVYQTEYSLPESKIREAVDLTKRKYEVLQQRSKSEDFCIITCLDKEYPKSFSDLGNSKPPILYIKGNKSLLNMDSIAVIGTRKPSQTTVEEGTENILKVTDVRKDEVIVSGLALGCDKIAHTTALENNIPTIAVLPSGFDAIAPKQHIRLANEIIEKQGCLISEYEPDKVATKYTYVERDKLVAALAKRILVLECGITSGTMHTVNAGKQLKRILGVCSDEYDGNKEILKSYGGFDIGTPDGFQKFIEDRPAEGNRSLFDTY